MSRARAAVTVPERSAEQAAALWLDTARWASFVDGLQHVHEVGGDWPHPGAVVKWSSFAGGRGRVREQVLAYEPARSQTLDVQDGQIRGRQTLTFESLDGGAIRIGLELEYEIKGRSPFTPLIDLLFVRRAQGDSLRRTLLRFARELDADPRVDESIIDMAQDAPDAP